MLPIFPSLLSSFFLFFFGSLFFYLKSSFLIELDFLERISWKSYSSIPFILSYPWYLIKIGRVKLGSVWPTVHFQRKFTFRVNSSSVIDSVYIFLLNLLSLNKTFDFINALTLPIEYVKLEKYRIWHFSKEILLYNHRHAVVVEEILSSPPERFSVSWFTSSNQLTFNFFCRQLSKSSCRRVLRW